MYFAILLHAPVGRMQLGIHCFCLIKASASTNYYLLALTAHCLF